MVDFQGWSDLNELIHIPTRGAEFTWDNRRSGLRHTKRRLDRVICNQNMLDSCFAISCSTLVKNTSDHYPLLYDLQVSSAHFSSSFKFMKMWTLDKGCKDVISDCWNERVIGSPMHVLSTKLKMVKAKRCLETFIQLL